MANFNLADYETVDSRIKRFYADHPDGRITTELVAYEGAVNSTRWIVKASIWRSRFSVNDVPLIEPDATGFAFENDGAGMANKTSALENCETSAIGRALANINYSGDKRASREEMAKTQQQAPAPAQLPSDWHEQVAMAMTADDLQALYQKALTGGWWVPEVKAAFSKKKELING